MDIATGVWFSPVAPSMVILEIWLAASVLFGTLWALAGLLLCERRVDLLITAETHEAEAEVDEAA